jgi:tetratricopeptide (TPR) repeat protein
VVFLILLAGSLSLPGARGSRGKEARMQLRFGVNMAERGAWKEAQYRFLRAATAAPGDAEILNNLAVAYENNGLYAEAEDAYLQALEHAPGSEKIRSNYERFRVFYTDHLEKLQREGEPEKVGRDVGDSEDG